MKRCGLLAWVLTGLTVLAGSTTGCAAHVQSCHSQGCPPEPAQPDRPSIARTNLAEKILTQPTPALAATFRSLLSDHPVYHPISPMDCQCEAVAQAPGAAGLDHERARIEQQSSAGRGRGSGKRKDRQSRLQAMILAYTALEIRNDAAGLALGWYYQAAGGEVKVDLTKAGIEYIRKVLLEVERMQGKGLKVPVEIEKIRRELLRLEEERTDGELTVVTYNERLHGLLNHGCHADWRLWPEPLPPGGAIAIPDCMTAISLALAERPYLVLLRGLLQELDAETLPVIRDMLRSVNGLLAMEKPTGRCKRLDELVGAFSHGRGDDASLETVHRQLCTLLQRQEARVASEVRVAIAEMRAHHEMTIYIQQQVERWDAELQKMQEKVSRGLLSSLEMSNAELDRLKSQGAVCREWLAFLASEARLRQAQGLLVQECQNGHDAHGACSMSPTSPGTTPAVPADLAAGGYLLETAPQPAIQPPVTGPSLLRGP